MRNEAGERTLLTRHPVMWGRHPLLFAVSVLLSFAGVGLVIILLWLRRCRSITVEVTDRRTILRYDLPSPQTIQVRHSDVRTVEVRHGRLQKMVGAGDLLIGSAGHTAWELEVRGLPRPEQIAGLIQRAKSGSLSSYSG